MVLREQRSRETEGRKFTREKRLGLGVICQRSGQAHLEGAWVQAKAFFASVLC